MTSQTVMLEIGKTLISLDLIERFFCCDIDICQGACCIEGDAGAPITQDEKKALENAYPIVKDMLLPGGKRAIEENGVAYIDEEGDLVTTIVDGGNCAFSTYAPGGKCICALECAHAQGKIPFRKPVSCFLYPVRITEYKDFTAVNFHRWKICRSAESKGRRIGLRAYQFLKQPLTQHFGKEWYDELCMAAEAYLAEYGEESDNQ